MPFEVIRNDIGKMVVDAIVSPSGEYPKNNGRVGNLLAKLGGEKFVEAREKIGKIEFGKSIVSPGFNLSSDNVIHTSIPRYKTNNSIKLLRECYRSALILAKEKGFESIAFPLLGAGENKFPKKLAFEIAISEIREFLDENDMLVFLVVFDKDSFMVSKKLFDSIVSYIDDRYEEEIRSDIGAIYRDSCYESRASSCSFLGEELDEYNINRIKKQTFSENLMYEIEMRKIIPSKLYKKANIDRRHFSKIRNNPNYQPSKNTAIAFALALELDLDETFDFLETAGYTLTYSSRFDIIIMYCIEHKIYDIFQVNEILYKFEEPLLGY